MAVAFIKYLPWRYLYVDSTYKLRLLLCTRKITSTSNIFCLLKWAEKTFFMCTFIIGWDLLWWGRSRRFWCDIYLSPLQSGRTVQNQVLVREFSTTGPNVVETPTWSSTWTSGRQISFGVSVSWASVEAWQVPRSPSPQRRWTRRQDRRVDSGFFCWVELPSSSAGSRTLACRCPPARSPDL